MMKKSIILFVVVLLIVVNRSSALADDKFELPPPVLTELKRVEETYHILDITAEKIWPGWKDYKNFPFLFTFENGLRVLIGHPNPPASFELLPDIQVAGKQIYFDRSNLISLKLEQPLSCGGGILPYGTVQGKLIDTVSMSFSKIIPDREKETGRFKAEDTILIYIHELFHCFQKSLTKRQFGNLEYNPDLNYAIFSEIEGSALEKAYDEKDPERSKEYLKDFILARELKRASMSAMQQNEESSDDFSEGTANYSEVRSLEILKEGYATHLTSADDPYYDGFKDADSFLQQFKDRLNKSSRSTYESNMKCYDYGCFQALLLQRFFPGWQEDLPAGEAFLDEEIMRRIPVTSEERARAQKRFREIYNLDEIAARHRSAIENRDATYKQVSSRKGKSIIISFKNIRHFISTSVDPEKRSFRLGLINIYPDGIGTINVDDIELAVHQKPTEINQLYYLRLIDPG